MLPEPIRERLAALEDARGARLGSPTYQEVGRQELAPPKRGRGRPTTYDPSFCERVIELGEQGKSKAQVASELRCSRKSLYLWMKVHREFAEAMEEAQFAALAWWEDMGRAGLKMGSKFNASLYAYQMKNRFRKFYADKVDVEHTAKEEPKAEMNGGRASATLPSINT